MRVVWVSDLVPGAGSGLPASLERQLIESAAANHDVHVISSALPPGEVELPLGDVTVTAEGVPAYRVRYPWTPLGFFLPPALSGQTVDLRAHGGQRRAVADVLERRLRQQSTDLVHVSGAELASVADVGNTAGVPSFVLLYGLLFRYCRQRKASASDAVRALHWSLDEKLAERWERKWYQRADGLGCTSEEDVRALGAVLGCHADLVDLEDANPLGRLWEANASGSGPVSRSEGTTPVGGSAASVRATRPTSEVVICTRNRPQMLKQCLETVSEAIQKSPETGLLVVEQGERTAAAVCSELGVDAEVLHDDGVGAARARNLGTRHARADVVLFTDDDCAVPPTWVTDHLAVLADPEVIASFGVVDGISRFASDGPDPVAWQARHRTGSPPWVVGHSSNMAIRRRAMLAVGGFDERFGPGSPGSVICEDADLIVRLLHAGGVVTSGTGQPIRHLDWRSDDEEYRNLRGYELGAGAWIGKLFRHEPSVAVPYLRQRVTLLDGRLRDSPGITKAPVPILLSFGAFLRGLVFGIRLPWWDASSGSPPQPEPDHR